MALRAENVRLGETRPRQRLLRRGSSSGAIRACRRVYDVELGGQRLEALELGTAARHDDGEISLTLPPDNCWAYRDEGQASLD